MKCIFILAIDDVNFSPNYDGFSWQARMQFFDGLNVGPEM